MTITRTSRRGFMIGAGAAALSTNFARPGWAAAPTFKTVAPGVLTIANSNEMPMIAMENGKLIGSDAEIVATIAQKLGLGVVSAQMEWSATVQSVKSGRADIMCGNMGWTPARAQALAITDAIYYAGAFVCMKKEQPFTSAITVNDVKGQYDRHGQRVHHRAGDEEAARRQRGEALRQQRRLRARRGRRAARFRGARRPAGRLHDPEEPELEPEAGGADRGPRVSRSSPASSTPSWA